MTFATGSRYGIKYVTETTFGTTPGTPTMTFVRTTGAGLNLSKTTYTSDELRSDRMIAVHEHGNKSVGGSVPFELSYGTFDDFLAGLFFSAWTSNTLKPGATQKSFSIEDSFGDIGVYRNFTGCMLNSMSLSIQPNAMVTGSFDFVGKSMTTATGTDASATVAANTYSVMDSFSGSIYEGGTGTGDVIAVVTGLDLNITNGLEPAFVVGSTETPQVVAGRFDATGAVTAYFEDKTLLDKFVNETESEIQVALSDGTRSYTIFLPKIKYSGGDLNVQGEGAVTVSLPFQALYSNTTYMSCHITRATS